MDSAWKATLIEAEKLYLMLIWLYNIIYNPNMRINHDMIEVYTEVYFPLMAQVLLDHILLVLVYNTEH